MMGDFEDWCRSKTFFLGHLGRVSHDFAPPPPLFSLLSALLPSQSNQGTDGLVSFDASSPLNLDPVTKANFTVWHAAPVLSNGWAVLGETAKVWGVISFFVEVVADTGWSGVCVLRVCA